MNYALLRDFRADLSITVLVGSLLCPSILLQNPKNLRNICIDGAEEFDGPSSGQVILGVQLMVMLLTMEEDESCSFLTVIIVNVC